MSPPNYNISSSCINCSKERPANTTIDAHDAIQMERKCTPLSTQEEQILSNLVATHGNKSWSLIAQLMHRRFKTPRRTGKQCRERWNNHIRLDHDPSPWNQEDELALVNLHRTVGNKWVLIAQSFPTRSVNSVKNHFYSSVRRSLRKMCHFTGTVAKELNAYTVKPATFSNIFTGVPAQLLSQLDSSLPLSDFPSHSDLSKYLIAFMSEEPELLHRLQSVYSVEEVRGAIQRISALNQLYSRGKAGSSMKKSRRARPNKSKPSSQAAQEENSDQRGLERIQPEFFPSLQSNSQQKNDHLPQKPQQNNEERDGEIKVPALLNEIPHFSEMRLYDEDDLFLFDLGLEDQMFPEYMPLLVSRQYYSPRSWEATENNQSI